MPVRSSTGLNPQWQHLSGRLDKKGKAIINTILDNEDKLFSPDYILDHTQEIVQKVKDAGNMLFADWRLRVYISDRCKDFKKTRSSVGDNFLLPSTPFISIDEEDKIFGQISRETRLHLRWLYQVIDKKEYNKLAEWLCESEYAVTLQEITAYFTYLQIAGVPVFEGLTEDVRLRLQGLVRTPGADQGMFNKWARNNLPDNVEGVFAYIEHLQRVMGLEPVGDRRLQHFTVSPRHSHSKEEYGDPTPVPSCPPADSVMVTTPRPTSLPSCVTRPETNSTNVDVAHDSEGAKTTVEEHRGLNGESQASMQAEKKDQEPAPPKDTSHASGSTKRKSPVPEAEDSFTLFGNHPLRTGLPPVSQRHATRIAPVHTRSAHAQNVCASTTKTSARDGNPDSANRNHPAVRSINIPNSEGSTGPEAITTDEAQNQAPTIRIEQPSNMAETPRLQTDEKQSSPSTEHQLQAQKGYAAKSVDGLDRKDEASTSEPPVLVQDGITMEDIDDDEKDEELMYPINELDELESEESTEMEIDELESDDEQTAQSLLQTEAQRNPVVYDERAMRLGFSFRGRTVEEMSDWIDKNERQIEQLTRYKDDLKASGLAD